MPGAVLSTSHIRVPIGDPKCLRKPAPSPPARTWEAIRNLTQFFLTVVDSLCFSPASAPLLS